MLHRVVTWRVNKVLPAAARVVAASRREYARLEWVVSCLPRLAFFWSAGIFRGHRKSVLPNYGEPKRGGRKSALISAPMQSP